MPGAFIAVALALADPGPPPSPGAPALATIDLAIRSGRLDQARLMIADQLKAGQPADTLNRPLADLAFAAGHDEGALSRYQALLGRTPGDPAACERAGIAALRLNRLAEARTMLACATDGASATWRSWNARGVLADLEQDWQAAAASYAQALRLNPANPRILNNVGYSHLLQGDWAGAVPYFARARAVEPSIARIANNLELARAAIDGNLPHRLPDEAVSAWAARLNDAGVAAQLRGDRQRAIASFTRALEASGPWYARAANNLEAVSAK